MITIVCVSVIFGWFKLTQLPAQEESPGSQTHSAAAGPIGPARSAGDVFMLLDALEASLAKNPQLALQRYAVDAQIGVLRTAHGRFDWSIAANGVQQHAYTPLTPTLAAEYTALGAVNPGTTVGNASVISASAVKEYRSGITVTPTIEATRNTDNVVNQDGLNQAHAGLQITLPLLRDRGKAVVDAAEIAARQTLEATRMDLSQQVSDTLAATASRYWSLVAADATLAVYKSAEARGSDLVKGAETLVQADRLPANDLNEVRANLDDRKASRTGAEQAVVQARQQLVLTMGVGAEQIISLPAPVQEMPKPAASYEASRLRDFMDLATTHRADVRASRLRRDANLTLENAARNQLKPRLDVSSSVAYTGIRDGTNALDYPRSIVSGAQGADFTVGLTYSQTPANNAARGRLETAVAVTRQSEVNLAETMRTAATSVVVSYEGVRNAMQQVQRAGESVRYYQAALDGEREKYHLGLNSLVDVLTVEDRLTVEVLAEVNARLAYSLALVQLRQATGTIVQAGQDVQQVDPLVFTRLP